MRIVDALRDESRLAKILDPANPLLITGTTEDQRQARREWQRARAAYAITRDHGGNPPIGTRVRAALDRAQADGNFLRPFGGDPTFSLTT